MRQLALGALYATTLLAGTSLARHQPQAAEREVKALSADEVKQYLSGAGMGYARAAELSHFPGPMHVVELHRH